MRDRASREAVADARPLTRRTITVVAGAPGAE
jgi:hypothetical protein